MRSLIIASALAAALLFGTTSTRAETLRVYPVTGVRYVGEQPVQFETVGVGVNPLTALADAMRTVALMAELAYQADLELKIAQAIRLEDLSAFVHTVGSWDGVVFWLVPVEDWPAISVLAFENDADRQ